jgi:hypothetical protein
MGVNNGLWAMLFMRIALDPVEEALNRTIWTSESPHCLQVDVALSFISDKIKYYAVPYVLTPGFLSESGVTTTPTTTTTTTGTNTTTTTTTTTITTTTQVKVRTGTCIVKTVTSDLYLNEAGGGDTNGANVQLWDDPLEQESWWDVQQVVNSTSGERVNGRFTLMNLNSKLYLSVQGGGVMQGANVHVWNNPNSTHTQWDLEMIHDRIYNLRNVNCGMYLNVAFDNIQKGGNAIIWSNPNSTSTQWEIEVPPGLPTNTTTSTDTTETTTESSSTTTEFFRPTPRPPPNLGVWHLKNHPTPRPLPCVEIWKQGLPLGDCGPPDENFTESEAVLEPLHLNAHQAGPVVPLGLVVLKNLKAEKYANVAAGIKTNGGNIHLWDNPDSADSQWTITEISDGVYTVQNKNSGLYLSVSHGGTTKGANVHIWDNPDSPNQQWEIEYAQHNAFTLRNVNCGMYLNVASGATHNSANVIIWDNPNSTESQWVVQAATEKLGSDEYTDNHTKAVITPGRFVIRNVNSGRFLNVAAGGTTNGANVHIWNNPEKMETQWDIQPVTGSDGSPIAGRYTIENANADRYLSVSGGGITRGANVHIWDNPDSPNQQWTIREIGESLYTIQNVNCNMYLNVASGANYNGANVIIWTNPQSTHNQWQIQVAPPTGT